MAQLVIEFFCEEIPARMQARAEADLERLLSERLKGAGLSWTDLQTFSGPRRLGLVVEGLPVKTEDVREERKGPKVGAPDKAIEGFLRSAGLDSLDQCKIEEGKKGAVYIALIEKPGRETAAVVAEALPEIAKAFPWPKSMKFARDGVPQRWVRPLQRVIALLDGAVIDTEVFGIKASNITEGHRIHGDGPFAVEDFADYEAQLRANGVTLTRDERRETIQAQARKVCEEAGLKLVEDKGLLEEVTGLVEYPVAILGDMDPEFLDLPPEVIQLTMKTHQKYFAVEDASGKITSKFVVIANQAAPDGGTAIAAGNARVLSARLSDARHFWDLDRARGLEAMAAELSKVTFHEKLGTLADKVERVAALAKELAPAVGADPDLAYLAAKLAKADLVSQMVYEFPELQGAMGRYYALETPTNSPEIPAKPQAQSRDLEPDLAQGPGSSLRSSGGSLSLENVSPADRTALADAIRDHYKPQGPSDAVTTAPLSAAVALADKLDTLVGFWAIDEKPTGSKDPFALRRAALGVIRILLEGRVGSSLKGIIRDEFLAWVPKFQGSEAARRIDAADDRLDKDNRSRHLASTFCATNYPLLIPLVALRGFDADSLYRSIVDGSDYDLDAAQQVALTVSTFYVWAMQITDLPQYEAYRLELIETGTVRELENLPDQSVSELVDLYLTSTRQELKLAKKEFEAGIETIIDSLLAFFADRLKVHLKDDGIRHDVIDAVFALGDDDLVRVTAKSRALQAFLNTENGAALLAGYRRAANILSKEEGKGFDLAAALSEALPPSVGSADTSPASGGGRSAEPLSPPVHGGSGPKGRGGLTPDQTAALMIEIAKTAEADEERALIAAIEGAETVASKALADEDFEGAMEALSQLRAPVDAFFEAVVVNDERLIVRRNRLLLLSRIRAAADAVADFSRLEGETR